jgi:hypothetical protein
MSAAVAGNGASFVTFRRQPAGQSEPDQAVGAGDEDAAAHAATSRSGSTAQGAACGWRGSFGTGVSGLVLRSPGHKIHAMLGRSKAMEKS